MRNGSLQINWRIIMKKIKPYKNKKWLQKKYWKEKLSIAKIAKKINISQSTIYKWMKRFNIPRRSISEACIGIKASKKAKRNISKAIHLRTGNHCQLSRKAIEWIEGELLGDGCLYSQSKYSAFFSYSSKHWEYIHYVSDILKSFGIEQIRKIYKYRTNDNVTLFPNEFHYQSRSYEELKLIRNKWYPDGKKIVPKDLKLTPLTLRQEYIGDGCLHKPKDGNPCIILFTNGFSISDVEWLVEKLNKLNFKATRQSSNNSIHISTKSTPDFFNYIGECPVKCYKYKWVK